MTTETEVVRSTAYFHEREPRSLFASTLREVFLADDNMFVTPYASVREVFYISDDYVESKYSKLREVARIHGTARPTTRVKVTAREVAQFNTFVSATRTVKQTSREVAHIFGRVKSPPTAKLREVFRISGRAAGGGVFEVTLREVFYAASRALPSTAVVLREVFLVDDAYDTHVRAVETVREVALFDDNVITRFQTRIDLHEVFYADDRISSRANRRAELHEIFYADDRAIPPPTGRAFTANILTFGMSMYVNYPFLTKAGNYAAGANLWRLDATTDYNVPTPAWITTGKLDIGTSRGKRPSALYAAGSSLEPLTVVVTGDVNGQLAEFEYTLDLRDQTDYRNNKAFLGKGFRSRYLQFKLGTVKYLGFRLLNAEVDMAVSPRRVA